MRLLPLTALCVGLSLYVAHAGSQGSKSTAPLPSLAALEKLKFTAVSTPPVSNEPDHVELQEAIQSFLLFRDGKKEVGGWLWNEPPRTRGPKETAVYNAAVGSVVFIQSAKGAPVNGLVSVGSGTGAILAPDDVVLTNWHVVQDAYTGGFPIMVYLKPAGKVTPDDALALRADVVYYNDTKDLALLKFRQTPPYPLPKLKIGSMSGLAVGQNVHIIGHPRGDTWSYGTGIISQIRPNYQTTLNDENGKPVLKFRANALQLQAAINPGNSGGPVLNDSGLIIGVVSFVRTKAQNLDYAVAADEVVGFLERYDANQKAPPKPAVVKPPEYAVAPLPGGRRVAKAQYDGSTVYMILELDGRVKGMVADTGKGDVIEATQPDGNDGFRRWVAKFADGRTAEADAENGHPVRFRTRTGK